MIVLGKREKGFGKSFTGVALRVPITPLAIIKNDLAITRPFSLLEGEDARPTTYVIQLVHPRSLTGLIISFLILPWRPRDAIVAVGVLASASFPYVRHYQYQKDSGTLLTMVEGRW